MLRKTLLGAVLAFGLALQAPADELVVKVRPPKVKVERRPVRPAPEYVWVSGYHRWDGAHYEWVSGRWERPPRARAHWVRHHWVHRRGGWVLVEGHWAYY